MKYIRKILRRPAFRKLYLCLFCKSLAIALLTTVSFILFVWFAWSSSPKPPYIDPRQAAFGSVSILTRNLHWSKETEGKGHTISRLLASLGGRDQPKSSHGPPEGKKNKDLIQSEDKNPFIALAEKRNHSSTPRLPPVSQTVTEVPVQTATLVNANSTTAAPSANSLHDSLHNDINFMKQMLTTVEDFKKDEYLADNSSFFFQRPEVVNDFTPNLLMQPEPCPEDGPFLLVAVPSADGNVNERQAVRDTWASAVRGALWPRKGHLRHTVKVVFFLGVGENTNTTKFEHESAIFKDIVRFDFADSYRNLTLKMMTVLQWTSSYCRNARHVLKIDEDTFVNLPLLLDLLTLVSADRPHVKYVLGARHYVDQPVVVREGKWAVDTASYPFRVFPRYLIGPSYIISGNAVNDLYMGYRHMPLVPAEDVYITGILAKTMSVRRIHHPDFGRPSFWSWCDMLSDKMISMTGLKPFPAIQEMWTRVKTGIC